LTLSFTTSTFDRINQFSIDVMMMALVARRIILLGQLDAVAFYVVDSANGRAVAIPA
jgi:hypothetical protein